MNELSDVIVGIVALNGGQLVGKTRLQKTFFLLEECGLNTGVDFDYRYFGPFSGEAAIAADDAIAAERIDVEERYGYHEVPYSIYSTEEAPAETLGSLPASQVQERLRILDGYSAIELEVAATILYLRDAGYEDRAADETKSRKPLKATNERVERALRLIEELGL